MLKIKLLFCIAICTRLSAFTQPSKQIHFRDYIFSELTIQKNVSYAFNIPPGVKKKFYQFDLYEATRDSSSRRPLIIWMHGGGFKFGSKKASGIRLWSKSFSRRGFVCVAINYRLSKNNPLRNFEALVKGCYEAVQDVRLAIEFFKKNNARYRIDTNRIILAGNSAGAIIALHSAYSSNAELNKLIGNPDSNVYSHNNNPQKIAGVINFWGAMFNLSYLNNAKIPIVSVHGKKDRIISYSQKETPLYGSFLIHQKADSLNISNRLKTYDGYGHELQKHFIPILRSGATKRRWLAAGQFAAEYLSEEVLH